MLCPKCRQSLNEGARFCSACGESIPEEPTARATDQPFAPAWSTAGGPSASSAALGSPAAQGLLNRAKGILLTPRTEWNVIAPEDTGIAQLFKGYVLPLAGLAVIVQFLHMSVVGISLPFGGTIRQPLTMGLTYALFGLVAGMIGVFLVGLIVNWLAPTFGGTRDQRQALKTAAYSLTPAWLGVVFGLLPMGTLLQIAAGVYGIYILYLGLPVLMRSRRESAGAYTATVVVCTIVLGILFSVVSAAIGVGTAGGFGALSGVHSEDAGRDMAANAAAGIIGGALGTDDKGKAGIASAISSLAKAGEQMEAAERAQRARQMSAAQAASQATGPAGNADHVASALNGTAGSASTQSDAQADAVNAAAGLMTALGGALGGGRRVEPVSFQVLQGLLPTSLPGMTREDIRGSGKEALGVKGTSATATYRGPNDARIEIDITDASGVSGLLNLADAFGVNETSESSSGYERQSTIAGRTVHEKFDRNSKHGELNAIVAKRFAVAVTGDSVDMDALKSVFGGLDLAALEGMKDAGAR